MCKIMGARGKALSAAVGPPTRALVCSELAIIAFDEAIIAVTRPFVSCARRGESMIPLIYSRQLACQKGTWVVAAEYPTLQCGVV